MLEQLEKQMTEKAAKENARLLQESEALKKQIVEDRKLADQEISKQRVEFENYKNNEMRLLKQREDACIEKEKEVRDVEAGKKALEAQLVQVNDKQKRVDLALKDAEEMKVKYSEMRTKAEKVKELYETRSSETRE